MAKKTRTKKISYRDPEFARMLIQKELDFHGASFDEVKDLPDGKINGTPWYLFYTFDKPEQYEEWKEFCIKEFMNTRERLSRARAIHEFSWLDLSYGLKQEYLTNE
jgi:hypothetical protein